MKHSQTDYPIGATWRYVDEYGNKGSVWLAARTEYGFEVWRWSFSRSDGSGNKFDQCVNKAAAVSECAVKFKGKKPRFKRLKLNSEPNDKRSVATEDQSGN